MLVHAVNYKKPVGPEAREDLFDNKT
ncbi:uncharacterized protein METZ01_LOCUS184908 [marine metagenome]|uniref:Uncharacterized protein n=1 Tax=marine metagenome TaxID=408172 RepID=A0A382D1X9_9ZZZZ